MRSTFKIVITGMLAALGLVSAALAAPSASRPLQFERLVGPWHEIARTPNDRQKACVATSAVWSRGKAGRIEVVNRCRKANGSTESFRSTARVVDPAKGRISMAFLAGVVRQEYVILDHAEDYSWSIMSTPNRKYVWIFARRQALPAAETNRLLARAGALGFNPAGLEVAGR